MKYVLLLILGVILCFSLFGCICAECNNDGIVDCLVDGCSGGIIYCEDCDGKGVLNGYGCYRCENNSGYNYVKCDNCNLGYITNPVTWQQFKCSVCNGKATVKEKCEPCNGMGYIGTDCSNCNGGSWKCDECDGHGTIDCPKCS